MIGLQPLVTIHPLMMLIANAMDSELPRMVECLKPNIGIPLVVPSQTSLTSIGTAHVKLVLRQRLGRVHKSYERREA